MVAVMPTTSGLPDEMAQEYTKVFQKLKVQNVEIVEVRTRKDAKKPEFIEVIDRAAGIFITGGNQL